MISMLREMLKDAKIDGKIKSFQLKFFNDERFKKFILNQIKNHSFEEDNFE